MAILSTVTQQPADKLDYDIDYTEWLGGADTILSSSVAVSPATGLTVNALTTSTAVKLWVSEGTVGTYKITVTVTTDNARVKQDELKVKIKDY